MGFRRGEAIGLRWSNVDFARGTICVQGSISTRCGRKTKSADAIYYKAPKTPSSYRVLALPRELATYLHDLRRRQQKQRLLLGSAYHTEWSDFVCVDAVGQLIKPDLVTRNFHLLLERIGLRHIRFHDLRHQYVKPTTKTFSENNVVLDTKSRTQLDAQGLHNICVHAQVNLTIAY